MRTLKPQEFVVAVVKLSTVLRVMYNSFTIDENKL